MDALRQRNRARLYLVWALVVPLVGVLRTAADLHWRVTRPGAYQSLTQVLLDDSAGTWLLWTVAAGLPVLVGIVLGVHQLKRRQDGCFYNLPGRVAS